MADGLAAEHADDGLEGVSARSMAEAALGVLPTDLGDEGGVQPMADRLRPQERDRGSSGRTIGPVSGGDLDEAAGAVRLLKACHDAGGHRAARHGPGLVDDRADKAGIVRGDETQQIRAEKVHDGAAEHRSETSRHLCDAAPVTQQYDGSGHGADDGRENPPTGGSPNGSAPVVSRREVYRDRAKLLLTRGPRQGPQRESARGWQGCHQYGAPLCSRPRDGGDGFHAGGTRPRRDDRLAVEAERLGYRRFWVAEHHGMPAVAAQAHPC